MESSTIYRTWFVRALSNEKVLTDLGNGLYYKKTEKTHINHVKGATQETPL